MMHDKKRIDKYIRRLRLSLGPLPKEERDEITREVESHLYERRQQGSEALFSAFDNLGTPEQYAHAFLDDYELSVALASRSTPRIFLYAFHQLGRSIGSTIGYLFFSMLYLFAFSLVLFALLKPVFPNNIGLWISPAGKFSFGFLSSESIIGNREILGWWVIPLALGTGLVFITFLTKILEHFLRKKYRTVDTQKTKTTMLPEKRVMSSREIF